jgi:hypothetical protein
MSTPSTYTCPCGTSHALTAATAYAVRDWGTVHYSARWQHTCPDCDRLNIVHHDGHVMYAVHEGKTRMQQHARKGDLS